MPIEVPPIETTVPVTTEQPLICDALNIDTLALDGTGRDNPATPPTLRLIVTPYKAGTPNQYAGQPITYTTADLYTAAARVPAIGQAIGAVFAAVADWHAYNEARRADLAVAMTASGEADADAANAAAAFDAAAVARDQAFVSRTGVDDPIWITADAAWKAADASLSLANAAAAAKAERVTIAQAAVDDPANPPLEPEVTA